MTTQKLTRAQTDDEIIYLWLSQKTPLTYQSYTTIIKQFREFCPVPLADLTLEDLSLWVRRLQLTYKPATIGSKITAVKSLLSFCVKVGYLSLNVGSLLKIPSCKDARANRMLSQDEIKALLNVARGRDRLLILTIYSLGLRVSEAINLRWSDLSESRLTIFGKGSKTRVLNVPQWLLNEIKSSNLGFSCYIFPSKSGKQLDRFRVHRIVKNLAIKAGINPELSTHWLRHSHASHSLRNGCDLELLRASLGHSKLETTSKYLHADPSQSSSLFLNPLN